MSTEPTPEYTSIPLKAKRLAEMWGYIPYRMPWEHEERTNAFQMIADCRYEMRRRGWDEDAVQEWTGLCLDSESYSRVRQLIQAVIEDQEEE